MYLLDQRRMLLSVICAESERSDSPIANRSDIGTQRNIVSARRGEGIESTQASTLGERDEQSINQ